MKKTKEILRQEQKKFIKYSMKNLNEYVISEMPTAFGKTITALGLASKIVRKRGKKVIIVTSNNLLAKNMFNESKKFEDTKEITSLVIGKDNYTCIKKLEKFLGYFDIGKAKKFCKKKMAKEGYVLTEELLKYLKIEDENIASFLKEGLKKEDGRDIELGDTEISITNYPYLLSLFLFRTKNKKINPDEFVFIFDEVHTLIDSAEMILSSAFSPYKLYLYTKALLNDISKESFVGSKVLTKDLIKYKTKLQTVYQTLANKDKVGEHEVKNRKFIEQKVEVIKKILLENELINSIKKRVNKYLKNRNILTAKLFLKELQEGALITHSSDIVLHYSKSRGYINFYTFSKNIKLDMALNFWKYIDSFIGMTATAILGNNLSGSKALYSYERLGINLYDIKDRDKTILVKGKLKKCLNIQSFKGVLSPKQARYYITDEDYIEDDDKRAKWIASKVLENFDKKNSVVLAGGYDEVDKIYDALNNMIKDDTHLTKAERTKSTIRVIDEFKRKGGIAILTRNFATGINLKGKLLEKLFITKLPYPVFTNRKWIELKDKNPKRYWYEYNQEMFIAFRQTIGRLIRDPNDRGDIYILDCRLKNRPENVERKIRSYLEKVAIEGDK